MKLMIIESPGKRAKLSAILGPDWRISASVGHIRDLPAKSMGVASPTFAPAYELTERGGEVAARLKKDVAAASEVYLATDPDREGEAISWHLEQVLKLKSAKRVTFNEITANAVNAALANPRNIDYRLVKAQEARRVLDRLTGYMVSPVLSSQANVKLSAGRVQSPALRLVVDRERAIRQFKVTNHFSALLSIDAWTAEWETIPNFADNENPYVLDRSHAQVAADTKQLKVLDFENSKSERNPPPPFTTSTMQQAASVKLGFDPEKAMQLSQKLYEQGHITYHRTDNPNVSEDALDDIRKAAEQHGCMMLSKQRKFKAPDSAQAGHPAVTPTHWDIVEAGETDEQRHLYKLIRFRAIASQLVPAVYAVRKAVLQSTENDKFIFQAKGETLLDAGWRKLVDGDDTTDNDDGEDGKTSNPIPDIQVGQVIDVDAGQVLEKKTKAPKRYTLASLVAKLESEGIGRPATYAAIMSNIVKRGYVEEVKKQLHPTTTGEGIIDVLVGKFEFLELDYTRTVETLLDKVASGETNYIDTCKQVYDQLMRELDGMPSLGSVTGSAAGVFPQKDKLNASCPKCDGSMHSFPKGYACDNKDKCGFVLWSEIAGRKLSDSEAIKLLKFGALKNLDGFKNKEGKPFNANLKLDGDGKVHFDFTPSTLGVACPSCKKPLKGFSKGYSCEDKDGCGFVLWSEIAGRKLSEAEATKLLKGETLKNLSGFVSKAGKAFTAGLKLNTEGKAEFIFEAKK